MFKSIIFFLAATAPLLSQAGKEATYIESAKMDAAYPKHGTPVDHGDYRVMAIGREKDGQAEIHSKDTDVVYFVEGSATLVTGGKLKDSKTIAPDEIRGSAVEGGEKRSLKAGDVITIPNGMVHQFLVTASCRYYLVKVRTNDEGKASVITALSKGGALGGGDGYKLSASHRDKDGIAELHSRDTDLMYFVKGTGTLVTGGTIAESKSIAPEETRGSKVNGGVRQVVKPGDVVVVPNTVTHQFVDVKSPLDYFVVKVRSKQ